MEFTTVSQAAINNPTVNPPEADRLVLEKEIRFWDRMLHKSLLSCPRQEERRIRLLLSRLEDLEKRFFNAPIPMRSNQQAGGAATPNWGHVRLELQQLKLEIMEVVEKMIAPRFF